ncbi:MAG: DUF6095 family protein [Bacteroidota bacterium]
MKGLKYMGWALPMFFIGPVVLHSTFKNEGHILFIPILGLGITICILAIFFMARGLMTILKSMTD